MHFNPEKTLKESLILDSQALQHLEIFESQNFSKNPTENSLFHFLNKTTSNFGHRKLKKWISSPLTNLEKINDRLNAIEDLNKFFIS